MRATLSAVVIVLLISLALLSGCRLIRSESTPPTATTSPTAAVTSPITGTTPVTLTVVGWNVESGGSEAATISRRIADFQGVDLWGLAEVEDAGAADEFERAAAVGENSTYDSVLGTTGGGDRLAVVYDAERFELLGQEELQRMNIGGSVRAPLVVRLRDTVSGVPFIFMVNHLYRGDDDGRHRQARLLNEWAASQMLPVIAVGDYNFDWEITGGDGHHDQGYDLLTAGQNFEWVRPQRTGYLAVFGLALPVQ